MDDVLVFVEASVEQAKLIHHGLDLFSAASDQCISYDKSKLFFSTNIPVELSHQITNVIGVPPTNDLDKYLGHSLAHDGRNKTPMEQLQKATKRLSGWKLRRLSRAGRITLTTSVLNTLPVFHMQIMKLPQEVLHKLDRLC